MQRLLKATNSSSSSTKSSSSWDFEFCVLDSRNFEQLIDDYRRLLLHCITAAGVDSSSSIH
ncbi:hypothetical protein T4D_9785 [Trichinella pseudospiralis]|uniref:Uncharacterized protein n=1 Tax=Trichinella pseudospiralis TaxID=6337 RepID=A0A0V1FNI5_TRIPS|nr:hypothetical protein T4D_9785 [Trichinella pseudospiralis]